MDVFQSFPGAGKVLAPRLTVAFGTELDRYNAASDIQRFSGIAPVTEQSGKSKWVHRRYACPRFLKQTFHSTPRNRFTGPSGRRPTTIARKLGNVITRPSERWPSSGFVFCIGVGKIKPNTTSSLLQALTQRGSPLAASLTLTMVRSKRS